MDGDTHRTGRRVKPARGTERPPDKPRQKVLCPHCCEPFSTARAMAVCVSKSLGTDPVAGADPVAPNLRVLPSRFSPQGNPLDPMGAECEQYACPRCRLGLSRANLMAPPFFVSLVGAPRAGKTFLLTSAIYTLQQTLQGLGFALRDASPLENRVIHDYGQRLMRPLDPARQVDPAEILGVTDQKSPPNSVRVRIAGRGHRLLKPFQFVFNELPSNPGAPGEPARRRRADQVLALYDNPGQDYLAGNHEGRDSSRHLRHSRVILFVLNPLGEARLRERCDPRHPMVRSPAPEELSADSRQQLVFSEMVARAAHMQGRSATQGLEARVVIVVSKSDLYPDMYGLIGENDYVRADGAGRSLDTRRINGVASDASRILRDAWPELMAIADAADSKGKPLVFPVSVFRPGAGSGDGAGDLRVTGADVRPSWVEVPFLWSFFSNEIDSNGDEQRTGPSYRSGGSP